ARVAHVLRLAPVAVCTIHSVSERPMSGGGAWLREWLYRLTNWACSVTTTISEMVAARYSEDAIIPEHRLRVIANGVDTALFRPDPVSGSKLRERLGWG